MQKGYYLSLYIHIDALANLADVQIRHDQTIALWYWENNKLQLLHYWELERLTGIKRHSRSFFSQEHFEEILNNLLAEYHISLNDIIEMWGAPFFDNNIEMKSKVKGISCHSSAHVYSVLLKDTAQFANNDFLVLAVDGGPDIILDEKEDKPFCACYSKQGKIQEWIPIHSPGPLWSIAKKIFQLEEGTLMALMSGCSCHIDNSDIAIVFIDSIDTAVRAEKILIDLKEKIFEIDFSGNNMEYYAYDVRFSEWENRVSMFMKLIQKMSNYIMKKNIEKIILNHKIVPKETYLSIVGGYALNCPSNSFLVNEYGFKGFYEIPCVSDTGVALGYGLGEVYKRNEKFKFCFENAYKGNVITSFELLKKMRRFILSIDKLEEEQFVDDIKKGPIIWVSGRAEIGPRALGHRSILADPRNMESKRRINEIKKRQWWRPIAPIVLSECVGKWFINGTNSEYMLRTFYIEPDKKEYVPAIVHLDNSARVQTITKETDNVLYNCITEFYNNTGIPMLCNTSLNDKREPIIDTIEGVIKFALNKKVPVIYINEKRILLDLSVELKNMECELMNERKVDFLKYMKTYGKGIYAELNPYQVSTSGIKLYYECLSKSDKHSLKDKKTVKLINKLLQMQESQEVR